MEKIFMLGLFICFLIIFVLLYQITDCEFKTRIPFYKIRDTKGDLCCYNEEVQNSDGYWEFQERCLKKTALGDDLRNQR